MGSDEGQDTTDGELGNREIESRRPPLKVVSIVATALVFVAMAFYATSNLQGHPPQGTTAPQ